MASLFKPTYTSTDRNGRKVKRKSGKRWIKFRDAEGIVRLVAAFYDKAASRQLAAERS